MSRYFKDFKKCSAALPHGRTVLPALAVRPHRGGFCASVPAGCPFIDKPSAAFYNNRNNKRKPVYFGTASFKKTAQLVPFSPGWKGVS